jgi:hypothetical protein
VTAAVAAFLTNHPGDNNFLIELGSADAPYGIVTCTYELRITFS